MDDPGFFYTISPPEIEKDEPKEMVGGKYTLEDVVHLAESILFEVEKKSSTLMGYDFKIDVKSYRILGIPFFEEAPFLVDGLKGKKIFSDAVTEISQIKKLLSTK